LFQKGSNGVGKEKKIHAKKWYKKELRLLHVMLDIILIVCLVVLL
jgi:hypothetical protein